jgi:hypothetical protein
VGGDAEPKRAAAPKPSSKPGVTADGWTDFDDEDDGIPYGSGSTPPTRQAKVESPAAAAARTKIEAIYAKHNPAKMGVYAPSMLAGYP